MSAPNQPDENEAKNRLRERFMRWQGYLRQNLSSHIALLVSWSAGGLAFCGVLLNSDHARFGTVATLMFLATGTLFLLCLLTSLFISWNRLKDTRSVLRKLKAEKDEEKQESIEELEAISNKLGEITWSAVRAQLFLFVLASIFLVITVLLVFKERLNICSSL